MELKILLLFSNQLSGDIPDNWHGGQNLESLNMSNNALTGSLAPLCGLSKLKRLQLHRNALDAPIPRAIGGLKVHPLYAL